jgi:hypothetical protein
LSNKDIENIVNIDAHATEELEKAADAREKV